MCLGSRLGFSLFHFHTLTPTLYHSPFVCLSHTCTSSHTISCPSLITNVWQGGVSLFLSNFSLPDSCSDSHFQPPAAPTHPTPNSPPYSHSHLLLCRNRVIFSSVDGLRMLSPYCAMDFQGGNRLFLFLPPNLHFISFSASSLSFSEVLSPKHPLTSTLSLFPLP